MEQIPATLAVKTLTAGARCSADIAALLRARNPLLWCITRDEARGERIIIDACVSAGMMPWTWDCFVGIKRQPDGPRDSNITDPASVFAFARDGDGSGRDVWIMRDLHPWTKDPTVSRGLASLCRTLPTYARAKAQAIVVLSASSEIPLELQGHVIVVDIPMPDRAEIAALLDASIAALPEDKQSAAAPNGQRDAAIDAAIGLSACEAQSTFARSIVTTRKLDPTTIANEKKRLIAKENVIEWIDPKPTDVVGGYALLHSWWNQRKVAFTSDAKEYGLTAPRGMLLVGVPGTGKSLTAKAVASAWGVPLLRLDVSALKSKWVGESEGNIRKALRTIDAIGRGVLWLDEIEKALGGATSGSADGGTSSDQLGALLNWMQERAGEIFVIATANDVTTLAAQCPELLRKGRFDEVFFLDVPTTAERVSIIRTVLANSRVPGCADIDVDIVAQATKNFTGAELSALLPDAAFSAYADGARPVNTDDLIRAAMQTVPLAKTAADKIAKLRQWAAGRARPASEPEALEQSNARNVDI